MLMRTIVSGLASASYLLVSVAPCPDLTLVEMSAGRFVSIESVPVQAHTQSHDSQHHHHDRDADLVVTRSCETRSPQTQHDGGDESLVTLKLSIPCPCGCRRQGISRAPAEGNSVRGFFQTVSVVQYPESHAAVLHNDRRVDRTRRSSPEAHPDRKPHRHDCLLTTRLNDARRSDACPGARATLLCARVDEEF